MALVFEEVVSDVLVGHKPAAGPQHIPFCSWAGQPLRVPPQEYEQRLREDGRVGIQLQSISTSHFFQLQKFFHKFQTEIVDGSKTVERIRLVKSDFEKESGACSVHIREREAFGFYI
eukprot:Skav207260  [mRNA]  locus=scaffold2560:185460:190109:- [translate_table: standard]